ncbi:MAG: PHP domain-containing protein [Chloroflexota bacterium]
MLRADLHIHTAYSMDSATTLEQVVDRCLKVGINCVAVADHGTVAGAIELRKIAPFKVVVAEEVLTDQGEVIGLFLERDVPSGVPAADAIAMIREQGGLVCLPHPCDRLRSSMLRDGRGILNLLPSVDIIEVFNSRTLVPDANARAHKLAKQHHLLCSAGSDAHTAAEIGNAWVEMPEFENQQGFLRALAQGRIYGRRSNPVHRFASVWARLTSLFS